ncbi:MAG: D-glycero-beta-D-manno-heptose-7-phosphate kinase [Syntrophobacteraceae bacterium]
MSAILVEDDTNPTTSPPDFGGASLLVFGDVMLDRYVWGSVRRISPEAPVPVVKVTSRTQALGGAGNVAANLAGLGCRTFLMGICGNDPNAVAIRLLLEEKGIADELVVHPTAPTTAKTRIMGQNQQLLRIDEEETEGRQPPELLDKLLSAFKRIAREVDAVILSDYAKGALDRSLPPRCISICSELGVPVFLDPKGAAWGHYRGATCITPNEMEFRAGASHLGIDELPFDEQMASVRKSLDLGFILVTQGAKGMTLLDASGSVSSIPTTAREVFDVSGAGDTVIATLAASVASGASVRRAVQLANIAAGVVVGKVGTQPIKLSDLHSALRTSECAHSRKTLSLQEARIETASWRASGKRVVFTNGCFDILHSGHVKLLSEAAANGDKLIVGLNSDSSVRRLKGPSRPVISETERGAILSALKDVDMVVLFEEDTPLELIRALRPDVLVKGGDYTRETVVGHDLVESWGGRVALIDLEAGKSTTRLIEKINREK